LESFLHWAARRSSLPCMGRAQKERRAAQRADAREASVAAVLAAAPAPPLRAPLPPGALPRPAPAPPLAPARMPRSRSPPFVAFRLDGKGKGESKGSDGKGDDGKGGGKGFDGNGADGKSCDAKGRAGSGADGKGKKEGKDSNNKGPDGKGGGKSSDGKGKPRLLTPAEAGDRAVQAANKKASDFEYGRLLSVGEPFKSRAGKTLVKVGLRVPEKPCYTVKQYTAAFLGNDTKFQRLETVVTEKEKKTLDVYLRARNAAHQPSVVLFVRFIEAAELWGDIYEQSVHVYKTLVKGLRPVFELHRPSNGSTPFWREII
ncbi:unnamed protein product, partial [Prorocentrum cordatum]